MSIVVRSGVGVSFVASYTLSMLYLVGSDDISIMVLLLLFDVPIDMPSFETFELLVSLFDVWS